MSIDAYTKFFIATFVLSAIPGPTVTLVIHYALMHGKRAGRYTIPAAILGDVIALALAFSSIGAIIALFPSAFNIFKIGGGIYLILLGVLSMFTSRKYAVTEREHGKQRIRSAFVHVLFVTSFNPKSIVFFLAFFPQFLNMNEDTTYQMLILGITFIGLGAIYAIIYDLLANQIQGLLASSKAQHKIHYFSGAILIGLGFFTIFL